MSTIDKFIADLQALYNSNKKQQLVPIIDQLKLLQQIGNLTFENIQKLINLCFAGLKNSEILRKDFQVLGYFSESKSKALLLKIFNSFAFKPYRLFFEDIRQNAQQHNEKYLEVKINELEQFCNCGNYIAARALIATLSKSYSYFSGLAGWLDYQLSLRWNLEVLLTDKIQRESAQASLGLIENGQLPDKIPTYSLDEAHNYIRLNFLNNTQKTSLELLVILDKYQNLHFIENIYAEKLTKATVIGIISLQQHADAIQVVSISNRSHIQISADFLMILKLWLDANGKIWQLDNPITHIYHAKNIATI